MNRLSRLSASVLLAYVLGFLWFAFMPPGPAGNARTDAIVVLTGGEGRIPRALDMLGKGTSKRLFVAGVDKSVKPREFAAALQSVFAGSPMSERKAINGLLRVLLG